MTSPPKSTLYVWTQVMLNNHNKYLTIENILTAGLTRCWYTDDKNKHYDVFKYLCASLFLELIFEQQNSISLLNCEIISYLSLLTCFMQVRQGRSFQYHANIVCANISLIARSSKHNTQFHDVNKRERRIFFVALCRVCDASQSLVIEWP